MPEIKVTVDKNGKPHFDPDPLPVPKEATAIIWVKDPPNAPFKFKDIRLPPKPFSSRQVTPAAITAFYDGEPSDHDWTYKVTVDTPKPGGDVFGDGSGTIRNH